MNTFYYCNKSLGVQFSILHKFSRVWYFIDLVLLQTSALKFAYEIGFILFNSLKSQYFDLFCSFKILITFNCIIKSILLQNMYLFYIRVIRKLTDKKWLMKIAGKDSKLNKNIFVIFKFL